MITVNDSHWEILLSYVIVLFRFPFHVDRAAGDCSRKGARQFLRNEEEEDGRWKGKPPSLIIFRCGTVTVARVSNDSSKISFENREKFMRATIIR